MVGLIVLCFTGVVWRTAATAPGLDWGQLAGGFLPDFSLLIRPAAAFQDLIAATPAAHHAYWTDWIVRNQRDVIVAAAATAVGINMTFLFPYSIIKRGWGREFSGLLRIDLATGMFIPFTLATSFVVIAAASQFHAVPQPGILPGADPAALTSPASPRQLGEYAGLLRGLGPAAAATPADQYLAATLVTRDPSHLAAALEPLTGSLFGRVIFGFGVLGMTLSTITLLMLISGMVVCELLGREHGGWPLRLGSLLAASGALGPFLWSKAAFWLAVPTSIFGFILMPIAYLAFSLLMNQRRLLGDAMPSGGRRVAWNGLDAQRVPLAVDVGLLRGRIEVAGIKPATARLVIDAAAPGTRRRIDLHLVTMHATVQVVGGAQRPEHDAAVARADVLLHLAFEDEVAEDFFGREKAVGRAGGSGADQGVPLDRERRGAIDLLPTRQVAAVEQRRPRTGGEAAGTQRQGHDNPPPIFPGSNHPFTQGHAAAQGKAPRIVPSAPG